MLRTTISFFANNQSFRFFFWKFHSDTCTEIMKNSLEIVCTGNFGRSGIDCLANIQFSIDEKQLKNCVNANCNNYHVIDNCLLLCCSKSKPTIMMCKLNNFKKIGLYFPWTRSTIFYDVVYQNNNFLNKNIVVFNSPLEKKTIFFSIVNVYWNTFLEHRSKAVKNILNYVSWSSSSSSFCVHHSFL
jgi:hypothetical protein